jgi:hypothetical protein
MVLVAAMLGASGCVRARAKTAMDSPPLDVPPPPPRDVEANESEPPQPVSLPQEPAHVAAPRPRPAPPQTRPPAPPPAEPRADAPAASAPEPPRPEEPPRPSPTLQTTPANAEGEVEKTVRGTIAKATSDLNRIDYRALNAEARTQYDTAKGFIRQAEGALRTKNLVIAKSLADKAAALAAQLPVK